ncbi:hypothetical protein GCM10009718_02590 [Isoptericola halotolerans]|uniref:Uncharacterized protein n=1 Tax=Isoptericola halotolerans TaxID=300560 RepID=A0ABX2A1Z8_9MICO|nr:hypothetical protein [Isoptericola halotolerans]
MPQRHDPGFKKARRRGTRRPGVISAAATEDLAVSLVNRGLANRAILEVPTRKA